MDITIWQAAIWVILFFSIISVSLQIFSKNESDSFRMSELIIQNKRILDNIFRLHEQLFSFNNELKKLAKENKVLRLEIRKLYEKINEFQIRIVGKEEENATCEY